MKKTSFNDHWTCKKQGDSADPNAVTLPHDAMLFEKRDRKAATAGACGYFPGGKYEYAKRFFLPSAAGRIFWSSRQSIKTRRCI